jgi:hypothetical protein
VAKKGARRYWGRKRRQGRWERGRDKGQMCLGLFRLETRVLPGGLPGVMRRSWPGEGSMLERDRG